MFKLVKYQRKINKVTPTKNNNNNKNNNYNYNLNKLKGSKNRGKK